MGSLKRRKSALRGEVYGWSSVSACSASLVSTNQGLSARVNYTTLLYIRLKHVWSFFLKKWYLVSFAAVLALNCSVQDILVVACELLVATCRVLVLLPGIKPMPLHWECRVLATGPTGKSPCVDFGTCGKVGIPGTDILWIPRASCTWQKGFM